MSDSVSNLDFVYDDADVHVNEIAELYSYTEEQDFVLNRKAFEDMMEKYGLPNKWLSLTDEQKCNVVCQLLNQLEVSQRVNRMQAARAVLYLVQGVFGECLMLDQQPVQARRNVFLLYGSGVFDVFIQLLHLEIGNNSASISATEKLTATLDDNTDLRVILNVLYTFVEVMRVQDKSDTDEMKRSRESFIKDLALPRLGGDLIVHTLFQMVIKFRSRKAPHFPIKKVLLLLWKCILVSLGGTKFLHTIKNKYRAEAGLPLVSPDNFEFSKTKQSFVPPSAVFSNIQEQQKREPIEELHVSLSEVQIKQETIEHPLIKEDSVISVAEVETLYEVILPCLPQCIVALLKIFLAATSRSEVKTHSNFVLVDVLPKKIPSLPIQSLKLEIDVNRHKEIIVKAISGIFLLLLKHLKINHVYQFEYISELLVSANCIPLMLKFFSQNIFSYVGAKNTIALIDFPACVIGEQPQLTEKLLEMGDQRPYCWRNLFSCVNLLRFLNKLTKWKYARIMTLVLFKSAPMLEQALKIKCAMMQLYVLKLLKLQAKYLGRQWQESNREIISAIYHSVHHKSSDDWTSQNELDARPEHFQSEEFALQANINRFHQQRYSHLELISNHLHYHPLDNRFLMTLGQEIGSPVNF